MAPKRAGSWPSRGPARVLLVLDRPTLIDLITLAIPRAGYATRTAAQPGSAGLALDEWQPHLVILDVDLDSRQLMEQLGTTAAGARRLPVIGITSRRDLQTRLGAFEAGVDDILSVPFASEELLARVAALLRRAYADVATFTPVIKQGELEIDIVNRTVRTGTSELQLTAIEQSLLYLLAANAGRIVTRDEILDTLWGGDYVAESNVVDRQIRNLRARLKDDWRNPRFIATAPGLGYQFLRTATTDVDSTRVS